MTATMLTRIRVEDYDAWKQMFDGDQPGARRDATGYRVLRTVEDPNEITIAVDFSSPEDAVAAREKLVASGVLERVDLQSGPTLTLEADRR